MKRRLKFALVLVMLALVPLRALATVTIGFCAMHEHASVGASGHAHHHDGGDSKQGGTDQCNSCVEHCGSASQVAAIDLTTAAPARASRIATPVRSTGGFVPDLLDPPPLVR